MKKLISLTIGIISILGISAMHVDAAPYKYHGYIYEGDTINNIYYQNKDNSLNEAKIFMRSDSNNTTYSIEYDNNTQGAAKDDYDDTFDYRKTKLTKSQTDRMNLIGYYGYSYKDDNYDHTDIKWYAITQFLIWKEEGNNNLAKIVDKNGNEIYNDEIKEIEQLIEHHYLKPDFGSRKFETKIHDKLTIEDQNKVMNEYELMEIKDANYEFHENKIDVTTNKADTYTLSFSKKDKRYTNSATFYISENYRDAMQIGKFESLTSNVLITSIGGKVFISKVGKQLSDYQGNEFIYKYQQVKGSTYHLYAKEDIYNNIGEILYYKDEKVDELNIDEIDYFDNLYPTNYYVKEASNAYSYPIDDESYDVHLDMNNKYQTLSFSSDLPNVTVGFKNFKESINYEDGKPKHSFTLTAGTEFGLFNSEDIYSNSDSANPIIKEDTLLGTSVSDEAGIVKFDLDLPLGSYYIINLTEDDNYHGNLESLSFTFAISSNTKDYHYQLSDYYQLLNAKDITFSNSGANITISIYDENKNLIIKDNITESYSVSLPFGVYYYQVNEKALTPFVVDSNSNTKFEIKLESLDNKIPGFIPWGGSTIPSKGEEPKKDITQNAFQTTTPKEDDDKNNEESEYEEEKGEEIDDNDVGDYKEPEELPKKDEENDKDKTEENDPSNEPKVEIDKDNSFEEDINKKEELPNDNTPPNEPLIPDNSEKDTDNNIKETEEETPNDVELERPVDESTVEKTKEIEETKNDEIPIILDKKEPEEVTNINKEDNLKNIPASIIESINTELNVEVPSTDKYDFIVYVSFIVLILLSLFYKNVKN